MAHTYRRFKQLLKAAKTRKQKRSNRRRTQTRRRKQRGGFRDEPYSGTSTVVAPLPLDEDNDLERMPVVRSAQKYVSEHED